MKFTKRTGHILNFISLAILLVIVLNVLGSALVPVTYAYYYKHDMEQMAKKGETYDLIFIGASRTYRSFDPKIFEKNTEYKNVLNAGSVAQTIEGSYYLAKELIAKNHPKRIVLGLSYNELFYEQEDKSPRGNMVLYDRLEDPLIKAEFISKVLKGNNLLYLSNVYRYGSSISLSYLKETCSEKKALRDSDFAPVVKKKEYYAGNGFVYSKRKVRTGNTPMRGEDVFDSEKVDPNKKAYLDKIVQLCRDNGVQISLVTGPTSLMYMYNIANYQGATDYYAAYASMNGLSYHNLGMLKNRLKLFPEKYMLDYNHVNGKGADIASEEYAKILNMEEAGESTDDLFYDDVSEIKKQIDYVVAVKAEEKLDLTRKDHRKYLDVYSLENDGETAEYEIRAREPGEKKYSTVYEYSESDSFDITDIAKPGARIAVYARIKGHDVNKEAYQIYVVDGSGKKLIRKLL